MFDLIKLESSSLSKKEYSDMTKELRKNLPMIEAACSHFGKTQSQFMDNFLTVSHPTPLRNARQILSEMNRSIAALKEAQYNIQKKKLLIKRLKRDLTSELDEIKRDEMELEIIFESSNIKSTMFYVEGALRAITNYSDQYKQILKTAGYKEMSEIDFEKEEEAYHIMKAFEQGICAARSRGGLIDEGNHIYFSQIGVNGQMAQDFVNKFFDQERISVQGGATLTFDFQNDFLKQMASFFRGCSKFVAESKGMTNINVSSLLGSKDESNLYPIRGNL